MAIEINDKDSATKIKDKLKELESEHGSKNLIEILNEMGYRPDKGKENSDYDRVVIPLDTAIEFYENSNRFNRLSDSSKKTYRSERYQFREYAIKEMGTSVTLKEVAEPLFLSKYLDKSMHKNTKTKKCAFLRSLINVTFWEYYKKTIDDLDLKAILPVKWNKSSSPKALEKEQIMEFLQLSASSLRNFTIIMTLLGSGIRLNELSNLRIGDIDYEMQEGKVVAKGKKGERCPRTFNLLALSVLNNYVKFTFQHQKPRLPESEYKDLYIFSATNGDKPLSNRTIQDFFTVLFKKTKSIPDDKKKGLGPHTIRHCFAVYGIESGIDIFTLSKLMGHESIETTTIYLDLIDKQLQNAIEKLPFAKLMEMEMKHSEIQ